MKFKKGDRLKRIAGGKHGKIKVGDIVTFIEYLPIEIMNFIIKEDDGLMNYNSSFFIKVSDRISRTPSWL